MLPIDRVTGSDMTGPPPDGQNVVFDPHIEVLLGDPWEVCHDHKPVQRFIDIYRGSHVAFLIPGAFYGCRSS
jgi:hypothetical protein